MDAPGSILRRRGLHPKKSWGQNFLGDEAVLARIAEATQATEGTLVVELGAGLGHLTQALADRGATVIAVERDRDLAAALREAFAGQAQVLVVEANAVTLDLGPLQRAPAQKLTVVGNLPYQLSSAILFAMLAQRERVERLVFLLQAEFVERLAAGPGGREYGVLSVMAQAVADVRSLFEVPAAAFHPRPAVASTVVELTPLAEPRVPEASGPLFASVVRGAFQQRRKTLANALLGAGFTPARQALAAAGIDPVRRAETLSLAEFGALTAALGELQGAPGT